jgi:NAD(P)H-dependent FMN reductase
MSGSLRRDSYNTALLRHAGDLFEAEGVEFATHILDDLRYAIPNAYRSGRCWARTSDLRLVEAG